MAMNFPEAVRQLNECCCMCGAPPTGTGRPAIEAMCTYVRGNSPPEGEEAKWATGLLAADVVEKFYQRVDAGA